jgi:hypothetical protein
MKISCVTGKILCTFEYHCISQAEEFYRSKTNHTFAACRIHSIGFHKSYRISEDEYKINQ